MCVKEYDLSAYIDGELSEQACQMVEAHLRECGRCSEKVRRMRNLRRCFNGDIEIDPSAPMRVRAGLRSRLARERKGIVSSAMGSGIYVPRPAVYTVAAVFLLLIGTVIGLQLNEQEGQLPFAAEAAPEEVRSASTQQAEMEELIRFFSSQGASVEVRIELPSSSQFSVRGEPKLMRSGEFEGY